MNHVYYFHLKEWIRTKKKIVLTRLALMVLLCVNFGNSCFLTLEAFEPSSPITFLLVFLTMIFSFLATYGVYLSKPSLLVCNFIIKVLFASASLFYALLLMENNSFSSIGQLIWLLIISALFISEIYCTLTISFHILAECTIHNHLPTPTYSQVLESEPPPPSYHEIMKNKSIQLDVEKLERNDGQLMV